MSRQNTISQNNDNLLKLNLGMTKDDVLSIMGKPEKVEAYPWGTIFLYRTAMTSGSYGTRDADLTPVVISQTNSLSGWGRNYYIIQSKKYDITIKNR